MNKKLSKRLSACLNALSSLSRIADIGTDHAYLPCYGVMTGIIDSAIATDVIDGPLEQAKRTVATYGLVDKIELRKGSGLEPLKIGEVEGANISGMGGKLIAEILATSLPIVKSMKRLVLQPQGGASNLRRELDALDIAIIDEKLVEEDGIIYTIITVDPNGETGVCTPLDRVYGPILRQNISDELFTKKWNQKLVFIDEILNKIPENHEQRERFLQKRKQIKDVLAGVIY